MDRWWGRKGKRKGRKITKTPRIMYHSVLPIGSYSAPVFVYIVCISISDLCL